MQEFNIAEEMEKPVTPMCGDQSYWKKTEEVMQVDAEIKEYQERIKMLKKKREKLAAWTLENEIVRFGYEMAMEKIRGAE